MDSEDHNERDNVRRVLWPSVHHKTKATDEEKGDEKSVAETLEKDAMPHPSSNQPATDFGNDDNTQFSYNGRRILKPVSRLGRTTKSSAGDAFSPAFPNSEPAAIAFADGVGTFSSAATSVGFDDPSTPKAQRVQAGGETPRTAKALRLVSLEGTVSNIDGKKASPGGGQSLGFDPSPKHYLARGMKSSNNATKHHSEPVAVTPRKANMQSDDGYETKVPDRPRSIKTAPPDLSTADERHLAYDPLDLDQSPSLRPLRRQMEGLSVSTRLLEHPNERPMGPRPFVDTSGLPKTPSKQDVKGKRAREDFEKTTSLSGRDVAREREILSQYAVTTGDMEWEDDEDEDMDDEDEDDTPKASVLNRHTEQ